MNSIPDDLRVTFYPNFFQGDAWGQKGNPHLVKLADQLDALGVEVRGVDSFEDFSRRKTKASILYLHWTEGITGELIRQHRFFFYLLFLTGFKRQLRKLVKGRFLASLQEFSGLIVHLHEFQSHEQASGSLESLVDDEIKRTAISSAAALAVAELGISTTLPADIPRPFEVWVPLGDYSAFHGEKISKEAARKKLWGTSHGTERVFAYVGTARKNRNPKETVLAFQTLLKDYPNSRLIIAGMNNKSYLNDVRYDESRVTILDGLLEKDVLRDVICAADFVIQDGQRYLTSAVIRTAISYERPVIAYDFGCTSHMASGCLIEIESSVLNSLRVASRITPEKYSLLQAEAAARNAERSWPIAGKNLLHAFRLVTEERACVR